jgi:hypothetical protein
MLNRDKTKFYRKGIRELNEVMLPEVTELVRGGARGGADIRTPSTTLVPPHRGQCVKHNRHFLCSP